MIGLDYLLSETSQNFLRVFVSSLSFSDQDASEALFVW